MATFDNMEYIDETTWSHSSKTPHAILIMDDVLLTFTALASFELSRVYFTSIKVAPTVGPQSYQYKQVLITLTFIGPVLWSCDSTHHADKQKMKRKIESEKKEIIGYELINRAL